MIWRVVDDASLMGEAKTMAAQLATQPTAAIAAMKRLFAASGAATLDEQLDAERDTQRVAGRGADFKEGVRAFLEKRPAVFTGRS